MVDCLDEVLGVATETVRPPIRRRRPWHGLGDLGSIDVAAARPVRTNVTRDLLQTCIRNLEIAHVDDVRAANERSAIYAKWRAQKDSKIERANLAIAASTMPISDTVAILTRAKEAGMPLAEVPLYENLVHSPNAVLDKANDATQFWGAVVTVLS